MNKIIFLVFLVLATTFVQSASDDKATEKHAKDRQFTSEVALSLGLSGMIEIYKEAFNTSDDITPEYVKKVNRDFPPFKEPIDNDFVKKTVEKQISTMKSFLAVMQFNETDHTKPHNGTDESNKKTMAVKNGDKIVMVKNYLDEVNEYINKVIKKVGLVDNIKKLISQMSKKELTDLGGLEKINNDIEFILKYRYSSYDNENHHNWKEILMDGLDDMLSTLYYASSLKIEINNKYYFKNESDAVTKASKKLTSK